MNAHTQTQVRANQNTVDSARVQNPVGRDSAPKQQLLLRDRDSETERERQRDRERDLEIDRQTHRHRYQLSV